MIKTILSLIFLDQITKMLLSHRDFFVWFVHIHFEKNFGLPLGLNPGGMMSLLIVIFVLIFFLILYFMMKPRTRLPFILIFAGAVSNLIDRLLLGYVRDFLDLGLGFTANFADALIIVGLISFLLPSEWRSKQSIDERAN